MKSAGRSELVIRCTICFSTIGQVSFALTGYKSAKQLSPEAGCNGLIPAIKEHELFEHHLHCTLEGMLLLPCGWDYFCTQAFSLIDYFLC